MSYQVFRASSVKQAKELTPKPGDFVILEKIHPKIGNEWKASEGATLPEEFLSLKKQDVIVIKVTERKTKFYKYPEEKSVCYAESYHQAIPRLE